MGHYFNGGGDQEHLPSLPGFGRFPSRLANPKERASVALRLLRQAAIVNRKSKSRCPFYSIRAVADHFDLPPTTVSRLYGQLKMEGVLRSIWGSRTIIEPLQIDHDLRLRAVVGLPVSLSRFAASPSYRNFFRLMQYALWKERFGSQLAFYEDSFWESSTFADALLDYKIDVVLWLRPPSRISNTIARLTDRGVRIVMVADGTPINGEPGYYLNRREALLEGLAEWKSGGISSVTIVHEDECTGASARGVLYTVLKELGISISSQKVSSVNSTALSASNPCGRGVIFTSDQCVVHVAHKDVVRFSTLRQENRVILLEGAVDLPAHIHLRGLFDTIEFDWRMIARRIVSDLVANRWMKPVQPQIAFRAKWCPRNAPRTSPPKLATARAELVSAA